MLCSSISGCLERSCLSRSVRSPKSLLGQLGERQGYRGACRALTWSLETCYFLSKKTFSAGLGGFSTLACISVEKARSMLDIERRVVGYQALVIVRVETVNWEHKAQ
jgi:hypothetical protein